MEQVIDARTSDAVALAIRFECPVYTYREILDKAGIILKEGEVQETEESEKEEPAKAKKTSQPKAQELKQQSLEDLHKMLDQAVKNEDYELAARLRDEIDKRSAN